MKKIIDISTKEEIVITGSDLPMCIHGIERSGASLFAITVSAQLHDAGNKLCIFTAFPMAKEEFMAQIRTPDNVFYLEREGEIDRALEFQTIIVESGNMDLFLAVLGSGNARDRILFIKNIETIQIELADTIKDYRYIVSGDLEANTAQRAFIEKTYSTSVLFSSLGNEVLPPLEKYQAWMKKELGKSIVTIIEKEVL